MNDLWNYNLFQNPIRDWAVGAGITALCLVVLRIIRTLLLSRLRSFSARTSTTIDDFLFAILQASIMPLLYVLAFYLGLRYLVFAPRVQNVLHIAVLVLVTFYLLRIITSFVAYVFLRALSTHQHTEQRLRQSKGILLIVQVVVWLLGLLFLINNLGYNVTTLVAGLGIGGIAIALAAQTILGDLFSYLVIFFDKPFEVGDFIVIAEKSGTVENIGIKTTRLRTLGGEQLICANTDLTNSRVQNFKRMQERRILFTFGVVYSTPAEKLQAIPGMIKSIVEAQDGTRFDRAHFKSFGSFSLDFEVVYYILSPDYINYMDRQQAINLELYRQFEKEEIAFAFPTQTLIVKGEPPVPASFLH